MSPPNDQRGPWGWADTRCAAQVRLEHAASTRCHISVGQDWNWWCHLVVYLVDDLGYHDVHFGGSLDPHNSDMHTPALVELAAQGIILGRHCEPQPHLGAAASPWPGP